MKFSLVPRYESKCPHCGGEIAIDWSQADEAGEECPHCGVLIGRERSRAEDGGKNVAAKFADLELDFKRPAKEVAEGAAQDDEDRESEIKRDEEKDEEDGDGDEREEARERDEVRRDVPLPSTDEAIRKTAREERALSTMRKAREERPAAATGEGLVFSRHDKFWRRGTIGFGCPVCGLPIWVKTKQAGKRLTCRSCASQIAAPVPSEGRFAVVLEDRRAGLDAKAVLPSGRIPEKGARAKREQDAPNFPVRKPSARPPAEDAPGEDALVAREPDSDRADGGVPEVAPEKIDTNEDPARLLARRKEAFVAAKSTPALESPRAESPRDDWQGVSKNPVVPGRGEIPGRIVLVAAAGLLALAIAGLVYLSFFDATPDGEADAAVDAERTGSMGEESGETVLYAHMEDAVRTVLDAFFAARSVEEKLAYVRHPDETRPRMHSHEVYYGFPSHKFALKPRGIISADGEPPFLFSVIILDGVRERSIALEETDQGLKIDWESYAGHSEIPWGQFITSKPERPMDYRVNVDELDYYNYEFADEARYRSFRLSGFSDTEYCYGYIERDHPDMKRLEEVLEKGQSMGATRVPLILSLQAVPGGAERRQVKIVGLVHEHWLYR